MRGSVCWFNLVKGYGFIRGEDERDYFVHAKAVVGRSPLRKGQEVEFEADMEKRRAARVRILS